MIDWEEVTCQAERDYDFMKEEELLMSDPGFTPDDNLPTGLTPDDHLDASQCYDFYNTVLRYASNEVLKYMRGLIIDEMSERPQEKSKGEIGLDNFMKEAQEIADGMAALKEENVF